MPRQLNQQGEMPSRENWRREKHSGPHNSTGEVVDMFEHDALSQSASTFSRRWKKKNGYKSKTATTADVDADSSPSARHDPNKVMPAASSTSSFPVCSIGKSPAPPRQPSFISDTPLERPRSLPLPSVTPPASPGVLRRPGDDFPRAKLRISFDLRDEMSSEAQASGVIATTNMPHLLSRGDDESSTSEEGS
ncbi:hypothetical protein THAOC_16441 [Thalassiosira oceanica]|uniref:Uncharacterized protein n=1 Tax=Thalassiosira oceanica TaxID=159749 RepID=K0SD97_THAOC|nr:hypothetical protein THAOC_16441 [Thalassiosira oceanica]|eukprot:EJK62929.1 hypothetical protein THAOC_16441 [Thalassiosira oceanica]